MWTFAAPSVPSASTKALCCGPAGQPSGGAAPTYWPCELLNAFVLRMAASGHCVNMSMMLGHRPYALEQLALARGLPDGDLQRLAAQLQAYFDMSASG